MDKKNLVIRAESWTLEKAQEFLNYIPVIQNPELANKFWQSEEDGGITLISNQSVHYFHDDGTIKIIDRDRDNLDYSNYSNDFEVLKNLYAASVEQNNPLIAECKEIDYVMINGELHKFTHWQSPSNELGIPLIANLWKNSDTILKNTDMYKIWVDHISWLIHALDNTGAKYPRKAYFENRLKNSQGYYFYDLQEFSCTYEDFYTRMTEFVNRLLTKNHTGMGLLVLPTSDVTLDQVKELITYAEEKWKL